MSGIMSSGSVGSCACAAPAVNHDQLHQLCATISWADQLFQLTAHNNSWLPTPALIILRIVFMLAQLLFSIMFCPDAHPQLSPLCCRPERYSDLFGGRSILYCCNVWLRSVQCIVVLRTVRNVESACERQPSPSCSSVARLSIALPRNIKATLPKYLFLSRSISPRGL